MPDLSLTVPPPWTLLLQLSLTSILSIITYRLVSPQQSASSPSAKMSPQNGRVTRITMFKVPDEENQKKFLSVYDQLARDQQRVRLPGFYTENMLTKTERQALHSQRPGLGHQRPASKGVHGCCRDRVCQSRRHELLRRRVPGSLGPQEGLPRTWCYRAAAYCVLLR